MILENEHELNTDDYSRLSKERHDETVSCVSSLHSIDLEQDLSNTGIDDDIEKPSVINLSNKTLSDPQMEILNKGLKFCPTQHSVDLAEVRQDLDKFHNSLRTKQYWTEGKGKKFLDEKKKAKKATTDKDGLRQPTIVEAMSNTRKQPPPFSRSDLIKIKNAGSGWKPPCGSIPLENWCHENIKSPVTPKK